MHRTCSSQDPGLPLEALRALAMQAFIGPDQFMKELDKLIKEVKEKKEEEKNEERTDL